MIELDTSYYECDFDAFTDIMIETCTVACFEFDDHGWCKRATLACIDHLHGSDEPFIELSFGDIDGEFGDGIIDDFLSVFGLP